MRDLKKIEFYKGMILIIFFSIVSFYISKIYFIEKLGISILIIAILLGLILSNSFSKYTLIKQQSSLDFSTKHLLRFAIILYGFRLTVQDLYEVGIQGAFFSFLIVTTTFILGYLLGVKVLKIDKQIAILVSAGSAICGAAAVLATEAILKNKAYKTSIAISTVVLFGTLAMFLYPFLYKLDLLNLSPENMAIFLGGTLHEVAHVVGAANSIENELISNNTVIVKMLRVMLLAPFLLIIGFFFVRKGSNNKAISTPWFAFLFIGVILFNSLNLFTDKMIDIINTIDIFLLSIAMFALGYKTNIKEIINAGIKPLFLAFILFLWLFFAGYSIVKLY